MSSNLTEDEMRQALFGSAAPSPLREADRPQVKPDLAIVSAKADSKRKSPKSLAPKLKVSLSVGNEYEGRTELFTYEASTLSTLQAELDAKKAARKKFRYVELVSVEPIGV